MGGSRGKLRDQWRTFRDAEFDYATLSHCCPPTRANDVAFISAYLKGKQPRERPPDVRADFMSEVECGPPSGCVNSRERYRNAYRWLGILLIDTTQDLSHVIMKSSAAGFSHWPPHWVHKAFGT